MEGRGKMKSRGGRRKIEIKRIENNGDRSITFSKRRSGIYNKANEIATLCGAEIGVLIFSKSDTPFVYASPSMESICNRFFHRGPDPRQGDMVERRAAESQRKARIDELNRLHNQIVDQLEEEKERGKRIEENARGIENKGWWEEPIDNLNLQELEEMNARYEHLQVRIARERNHRNAEAFAAEAFAAAAAADDDDDGGGGSSSSSPSDLGKP